MISSFVMSVTNSFPLLINVQNWSSDENEILLALKGTVVSVIPGAAVGSVGKGVLPFVATLDAAADVVAAGVSVADDMDVSMLFAGFPITIVESIRATIISVSKNPITRYRQVSSINLTDGFVSGFHKNLIL